MTNKSFVTDNQKHPSDQIQQNSDSTPSSGSTPLNKSRMSTISPKENKQKEDEDKQQQQKFSNNL